MTAGAISDGVRWCRCGVCWFWRGQLRSLVLKLGLHGCRVGKASNPGPRVKGRRRVESSVSETESDVVRRGADSRGPRCHSRHPQSPFLREFCVRCTEVEHCVHCSNHYARCQSSNRFAASTLIDPMEQGPHNVPQEPPGPRLVSKATDIFTHQCVSRESDIEWVNGASEGDGCRGRSRNGSTRPSRGGASCWTTVE